MEQSELQITGDISETDWIHFRLRSGTNVVSVHPYRSGDAMLADIPDELLQVGRRLIVYVYVADADGNKTTIRKEIAVRPRTKPDDYVYTPTEVKHWTDLEARIQKLEDGGATPEQIAAAVEKYLAANPPTGGTGSGSSFKTDDTLTLKDGVLSVNTTDLMEQDNTLPITSAGVYATVGNIEVLLKTI